MLDIVHEVEHLADAQGSRLRSWSLASLQGAVSQLCHEDKFMEFSVIDQAHMVKP